MEKLKKCIIILICFIIILSIVLLIFLTLFKNDSTDNKTEDEPQEQGFEFSNEIDNKYKLISSANDYFRVNKIINIYHSSVKELIEGVETPIVLETEEGYEESQGEIEQYKEQQKAQIKKFLLEMFEEKYTKEFNINENNLEEKVKNYNSLDFIIDNIYCSELTENINVYFINCIEIKQSGKEKVPFMIIIDSKNNTFSLYLEDYIKANSLDQYKLGEKVEIGITNIEDRRYNKTNYVVAETNDIVQEYFESYKKMLKYDTERLFNHLNEEYRNKKFSTLEDFNQYIAKEGQKLQKSNITKYDKQIIDDRIKYTTVDQNGKYYIFQETAPMQYELILDTYTIDLPEFVEKYEKANNEDKVLMNIQRFFDAINDGDYKYAYNKLDETYKANNFRTQADFENYVKNVFFEKNKLAAGTAEKQGDIYLYKVTISDKTGTKTNEVTKNFVVQLKQGTDFVMSFSVN